MLWTSGLAMSPMKNPKLSVAASSTKKPKMTFSRFMALLTGRVAGVLVADVRSDQTVSRQNRTQPPSRASPRGHANRCLECRQLVMSDRNNPELAIDAYQGVDGAEVVDRIAILALQAPVRLHHGDRRHRLVDCELQGSRIHNAQTLIGIEQPLEDIRPVLGGHDGHG